MWEPIQVSVGQSKFRGRFRVESGRVVLEWRGGRVTDWCGSLKPELIALNLLQTLAGRMPIAA